MSFLRNNIPMTPGAWMINSNIHFPLYSSMSNLIVLGVHDMDDYWYVLPGYKLIVWSSGSYVSDSGKKSKICDNTAGTQIVTYTFQASGIPNTATSCQLFYNNVEMTSVYNNTIATPTDGAT